MSTLINDQELSELRERARRADRALMALTAVSEIARSIESHDPDARRVLYSIRRVAVMGRRRP